MKITIVIILIICGLTPAYNQSSNNLHQIENRYSFVFFDLIPNKSDANSKFFSYQLASDVSYLRSVRLSSQLSIKYGVGYTFYYLLDWNFDQNKAAKDYFSMANIKGGIQWNNKSNKLSTALVINNYFLLNKELQMQVLSKRYFITVDPEIKFSLTNRIRLSVFSPIGVLSPFRGKYGVLTNDGFKYFSPWVEINGLGFGLSYSW